MTHTQVKVRKGNVLQVTWIPTWAAKVGNVIELKEENGMDPGWQIVHVYGTLPDDVLRERARDYTRTRKASDI